MPITTYRKAGYKPEIGKIVTVTRLAIQNKEATRKDTFSGYPDGSIMTGALGPIGASLVAEEIVPVVTGKKAKKKPAGQRL